MAFCMDCGSDTKVVLSEPWHVVYQCTRLECERIYEKFITDRMSGVHHDVIHEHDKHSTNDVLVK